MYLVQYSTGDWADFSAHELFVTHDEETARNYINKFNDLINKWSEYFLMMCEKTSNTKNERYWHYYKRSSRFMDTHHAFYTEIELR